MSVEIVCEKNYNRDGKHVYYFGIDESNSEKPFVIGSQKGMGIGGFGGQTHLGLNDLVNPEINWKEHLKKSGCLPWIFEAIELAIQQNDAAIAIDKLLYMGGRWK